MDADSIDYERYYRTLHRRRRQSVDTYRQYRASASLPMEAVDLPVMWHHDDVIHPLIGVSGYRMMDTGQSNSYTLDVSWSSILHDTEF